MEKHSVLADLRKAILTFDQDLAVATANKAISEKIDLLEAFDAMTCAIREIGNGFSQGKFWLPELVGAGSAMAAAVPIIEEEMNKQNIHRQSSGTIVLGTVWGDIHTIGKDMVKCLLAAGGFTVHDLGINVRAETFVEGVCEHKAQVLAMSALLTVTAPEQKNTIELLNKEGLRDQVKVIVGGGAITQEFADEIGADGYEATAPRALDLVRRLMENFPA